MSEIEINIKNYPIHIKYSDEDQVYLAEAPDLKGCIAQGITAEEALSEIQLVMKGWMETAIEFGWEIPNPSNKKINL